MKTYILTKEEYLDLLSYKLECKLAAKKRDSSWNYGIEELEKEISEVQAS